MSHSYWQRGLPASELERFLRSLRTGAAEIAGTRIAFGMRDSQAADPVPYSTGSAWVAARPNWNPDFERFPTAHRLVLYGDSQRDLLRRAGVDREKLEALVASLDHPWAGLDSLTKYALQTTSRIDHSNQTTVELVAPLEAQVEHCDLRAGELQYVLTAASRAVAEQCTVGLFVVQPGGGIISDTMTLPSESWIGTESTGYRCVESRRLAKSLHATLLLRVGPFVADTQTANDPAELGNNARLLAYAQFDVDLRRLTEILEHPSRVKNEDEFHSVVARLFTFAGFSVDSLVADESLTGKGIPDLLVHAPHQGWLLVVECTIGTLAGARDKLSWLVTRARRVQEALASGSGEKVLPVLVTALPELPQHEMEAARRSRIAVMTQGDLQHLLQLGRDQVPLQTILSWCHAKIPN